MKSTLLALTITVSLCLSANAQENTVKLLNDKFSFLKADSVRSTYVLKGKEGNSIIDLLSDSFYVFHSFIAYQNEGKFSVGRWKINNDSVLLLVSDKSLVKQFFDKYYRIYEPLKTYSFTEMSYPVFIISVRKYIYPTRPKRSEQ